MHHSSAEHVGHSRVRSAPQPCKPPVDPADQFSQSDHSEKDYCSQLGSSVSAYSDMQMSSPAEIQLESDLQCEERHQFLSSPQDSNTSALSYHDPGRCCSPQPANRHSSTPSYVRSPRLEHSRPSPSEVPTEALWDTESVACHGQLHALPPPFPMLVAARAPSMRRNAQYYSMHSGAPDAKHALPAAQSDLLMQSCLQVCQWHVLHACSLQLWQSHQSPDSSAHIHMHA